MDGNYWKKENPEYIKLQCKIEEKQARIDSGIITNSRTLKQTKRDIRDWLRLLNKMNRYLE